MIWALLNVTKLSSLSTGAEDTWEAKQVQQLYKDCIKGIIVRSMGSWCLSVSTASVGPQGQQLGKGFDLEPRRVSKS